MKKINSNPQLEKGFIRIATGKEDNDIFLALAGAKLGGTELSICLAVIRKTWGWGKKEDWISLTQFEKITKRSRQTIVNAVNELVKKTILVKKTVPGIKTIYSFNKNFLRWQKQLVKKTVPVQKTSTTSKENCTPLVKKTVPTKDTNTKDTIQKKDICIFIERFNLLFERDYKETSGRIKELSQRLKSFSLEDILLAVENLSKSPFHRGVNDRGWTADPDFIIRSDEQIDKWLNVNLEQAKQLSKISMEAKPRFRSVNATKILQERRMDDGNRSGRILSNK